jgi:sec-independent protein translocase protein TatA
VLSGLDNPVHLLILLVIVLVLFGAKRLPEVGRSVGSGMREFKDAVVGRHNDELPTDVEQPSAGLSGERPARNHSA